jgi:hypothetical protein
MPPPRLAFGVLVLLSLATAGCGGRGVYPVSGKVVYPDGTPAKELKGSRVLFEGTGADGKNYSAEGEIDEDGRFTLTTTKSNDGAVAGKNRALIERRMIDPEHAAPRVVHEKYERFETSGLEFDVQPRNNDFTITVEPVPTKKRGG